MNVNRTLLVKTYIFIVKNAGTIYFSYFVVYNCSKRLMGDVWREYFLEDKRTDVRFISTP